MRYVFQLEGEDHTHFAYEVEATSYVEAYNKVELVYPDAYVIECNSQEERARYEYHAQMYEEGWE